MTWLNFTFLIEIPDATIGSLQGGWISQYADAYQYLQIDLGKVTKVTRIATQGRYDAGWWTKTYTLDYSEDGGIFKSYNNGQVCEIDTENIESKGRVQCEWRSHLTANLLLFILIGF